MHSEAHLCEKCAREIGFNTKISDLTSIIEENRKNDDHLFLSCPRCGLSSDEFSENHLLGCASCYSVFKEQIHTFLGSRRYSGSIPLNSPAAMTHSDPTSESAHEPLPIYQLRTNLSLAIDEERYEDAAILRDLIKDREQICSGKD
jgi:protein arginine kinase activator